jgi:hypothetical protein
MIDIAHFLSAVITFLKALNDVLTAGIAVTAFSLLIFAFTYQLRDRLTRSYTLILICITIIYAAAAFSLIPQNNQLLNIVMHFYWVGLVFLPAGYFNFSDALLTFTGKPSRGRRKAISIITYIISTIFLFLIPTGWLVSDVAVNQLPAPYLQPSFLSGIFTFYFFAVMILAWYNMIRAINRSVTPTSRRRMFYLVIGAIGPAMGSFPYLLYGSKFAANNILIFWLLSVIVSLIVGALTIVISYAVAFYGFPWPDRVIKTRLFRWLMRGPITASLTLGATTLVRRLGDILGVDLSAASVLVMVGSIILLEFFIILFAPLWERIFFSGNDRDDLEVIRSLEDRMLTQNDLNQFLEMVLAVICDRVQAKGAFLSALDTDNFKTIVEIGKTKIKNEKFKRKLYQFLINNPLLDKQLEWEGILLIALFRNDENGSKHLIGTIGVNGLKSGIIEEEHQKALNRLASRAALALKDRRLQEDLLFSLQILTPQVSVIQNLLAAGKYDRGQALSEDLPLRKDEVDKWVKEALTHLWGGPKLSQSRLLQLFMVQKLSTENENLNPPNALREILRSAIQELRPPGDRQYTNEWVLYNLLDLKFIEGMKVKDIARRLSLSEADLYRKQRVAIAAVSAQLIDLENDERNSQQ